MGKDLEGTSCGLFQQTVLTFAGERGKLQKFSVRIAVKSEVLLYTILLSDKNGDRRMMLKVLL
jgi:hypothetical protein